MSQVSLKWITQRRLEETLPRRPRRLQDIIKEPRDNYVPLARLHYVSNQSQMKHPTTSRWYVAKTSQWYVSTMSHKNVITTSQRYLTTTFQANPKWSTQWSCGCRSPAHLWMTFSFNSQIIACIIVPCFHQTRNVSSTSSKGNKKLT